MTPQCIKVASIFRLCVKLGLAAVANAGVPLGQHGERDGSFGPLQDADGLFVRDAVQALPVHRQDLVAPLQAPVLGGGALGTKPR